MFSCLVRSDLEGCSRISAGPRLDALAREAPLGFCGSCIADLAGRELMQVQVAAHTSQWGEEAWTNDLRSPLLRVRTTWLRHSQAEAPPRTGR